MKSFQALRKSKRIDVIDFMSEFSLHEVVEINEKTFILVHAGLGNFDPTKKLSEYTPEELLLSRNSPDIRYFSDDSIYIVSGHTPTLTITGKAEILCKNNNIFIDCGATFGGRLGCLCLETMEEFYV